MDKLKVFIKFLFSTLLFIVLYWSLLIWAHNKPLPHISLSLNIIAYFAIAQIYVEYIAGALWIYIGKERGAHKLTATLGIIDQLIYLSSFALEQYGVIGLWLSIKIASRLVGVSKIETDPERVDEGQRRNAYLIGNVISLALGILGGILSEVLLNNNFPNLLPDIKTALGLVK